MVRTKYTTPRVKLNMPEVTEEMIRNYKRKGRPRYDKDYETQLIKSEIMERLLEERDQRCEQRKAQRQKEIEEQELREKEARERKEAEKALLEQEAKEREEMQEQIRNEAARLERERLQQEWAEEERLAREQIERERAEEARLRRMEEELERKRRDRLDEERLKVEREAQARAAAKKAEYMRIKRRKLAARQSEIDRLGEEEYYKKLRAELREAELRKFSDELAREQAQTKGLLTRPDPNFQKCLASLELQLKESKLMCNKCPRVREHERGSALEMQRMIELYDMIAEDWELDAVARGETAENHVTTTTPPCDDNEPKSLSAMAPTNKPKYWQYHKEKENDMDDPDYHTLMARFGSSPYYKYMFTGRDTYDPIKTYQQLEGAKKRQEAEYEVARQKFLQILAFHGKYWYKTDPLNDRGVEISRLHRDDLKEYLGFMRISCGGYRAETYTPPKMQIVFHLLLGRVNFSINKRPRILSRGAHIIVEPDATYAITCLERNQAACFVFHISFTSYPDRPAMFKQYFGLRADP